MVNGRLPNEGGSKAKRSCRPLARRNDRGGGCAPCSDSCGNGPAGGLTRTVDVTRHRFLNDKNRSNF